MTSCVHFEVALYTTQ